eukprot:672996-Alexandrium_andersonii.AAC.1
MKYDSETYAEAHNIAAGGCRPRPRTQKARNSLIPGPNSEESERRPRDAETTPNQLDVDRLN